LGKEPALFPNMVATYAAARAKVGRKVGNLGMGKQATDVFKAARMGRVELSRLDNRQRWHEALTDNRQSPVPDQAAFRIDFPAWLDTLTDRDRKLAETLAMGHSAVEVAQQFGVSGARITQIRQQLMSDWDVFTA
jgi:DNA-binding NarL/FixJ family response regulator